MHQRDGRVEGNVYTQLTDEKAIFLGGLYLSMGTKLTAQSLMYSEGFDDSILGML